VTCTGHRRVGVVTRDPVDQEDLVQAAVE
jgi:hypothetical protein